MKQELSRVLAMQESDVAHDAVVRAFWTHRRPAQAKVLRPTQCAQVVDLRQWALGVR
jgi:hypothetical protein